MLERLLFLLPGLFVIPVVYAYTAQTVIIVEAPLPDAVPDGICSLIEAMENANADTAVHADCPPGAGADTIELAAGAIYTLTAAHNDIDDGNGLPLVSSDITIAGNGSTITRDTAPDTPAFRLIFVVSGASLTLSDLTLTNGAANSDGTGLGGGGIHSAGSLALNNVEVLRNASETSGGGVSNRGGTVLVDSSEISQNKAVAAGGGLFNLDGVVSVTATTFSFNDSTIAPTRAVEVPSPTMRSPEGPRWI